MAEIGETTGAPVAGVVLAAGRGRRMGRPKAGVELGGRTFLQRCVSALAEGGCASVVVVVAEPKEAVTGAPAADGVVYVRNPEPDSEQIDSLRIGLKALPVDAEAAVVLPVDLPAVRPETVARLVSAFRAGDCLVVRPVYDGRPGHPTLFARPLFPELCAPGLEHGAESVVARHPSACRDLPVDDPGVLEDVNTPEDLRRLEAEP